MQVKSVIDALILVECHQIAIEVVSDEESLHGLFVVADIPDLDRQVVSREDVGVARWSKLGPCHRVNDLAEEVLVFVGFVLKHDRLLLRVVLCSQIADRSCAAGCAVNELIGLFVVQFNMSDAIIGSVFAWPLRQTHDIVCSEIIFEVPQVYRELVR